MSDSISHLRKMKRRQAMAQSKPMSDLSPGDKVDMLERTLSVFRKEVDMKLKIMQQILTTRNEQVSVQKKLLEREQTLYDTLLGHWKNTPKLAATGLSVNFTSADILDDMEDEENQSDPDYAEGEEVAGPSRKKSKSSLRRQRNSAKSTPKQKSDVGGEAGPETLTENPEDDGGVMGDSMGMGTSHSEWEGEDDPRDPPVHVELKTEGDDDEDNDFEEYSTSMLVEEYKYDEEGNVGNEEAKGKKRRSTSRPWFLHRAYDTAAEAEQEVKDEGWGKVTTYSTAQGERINYRCNKARKDLPCPKVLYILYHNDSQKASVYMTMDEHSNHVEKGNIPKETKEAIQALLADGISKPNAIISTLQHRGIEPPSKVRLANYLFKLRKNLSITKGSTVAGGSCGCIEPYHFC